MKSANTIVAISTPVGAGGIGIVRLSGERSLELAERLFTAKKLNYADIIPNYMYFGELSAGGYSDRGYMVYFKAPASFTGEDIVEFHLHGGVKLLEGVVAACVKEGASPAAAGEFTKRAYLNGKLALSDAEGVIDMINADSEAALNAAYRLMTGKLSRIAYQIEGELFDAITALEAVLDYPDELEDETLPEVDKLLDGAIAKLTPLVQSETYGTMAKYGISVVLAGATNAGKSSLLNALLGDDRAIVNAKEGTTRDLITESREYKGVKINFTDTAGLRNTDDEIEQEGVKRAENAILSADLVLYVIDGTSAEAAKPLKGADGKRVYTVYNKSDLGGFNPPRGEDVFLTSAATGEGVEQLLDAIAALYIGGKATDGEIVTNKRHAEAVRQAYELLSSAKGGVGSVTADCLLVDVKGAWQALGEITGTTTDDRIIDAIFSRFCVGK